MSTSPVLSSPTPSDTESLHSQEAVSTASQPPAKPSTELSLPETAAVDSIVDTTAVSDGKAESDGKPEEALVGDDALEDDTDLTMSSGELLEEHTCQLCEEKFKSPRILTCLHIFCTPCLEKQAGGSEDLQEDGDAPRPQDSVIVCSMCKQETRLATDKGVEGLPLDHVMVNMMDMSAIEDMQIICTSCKAKEKAVARCADCASFLCSNCVTAHQYMRCFENHKVVSFEELKSSGSSSLHKPIFCQVHSSEVIKSFCKTCQVAICNDCLLSEHKQPEHQSDRIVDLETQQAEELKTLVTEAKGKLDFCKEASSGLENALTELQMQRDNARSLIDETFQTYKVILEKRKEELLKELEDIHSSKELGIMEMFYGVEKTQERIEDGCSFTERMLANGNGTEILLLRKNIVTQLLSLINNTPKAEVDVKIVFDCDEDKFKEAIKKNFGHFKEETVPEGGESAAGAVQPDPQLQLLNDMQATASISMHSSFENEGINLPPGLLSPSPEEAAILPPVSAAEFVPPIPTLAPLSIPGLTSITPNMAGVSAHTINSIASSIQNLTTERSSSRNSYSPAMSDSGISVDAPSSNSSGTNQPIIDIAALARLGTVNVNTQGQITLNGQAIPGLNMGNVSGRPLHGLTTQTSMTAPPTPVTPMTPTPDSGLASLLNPVTSRAQTPLGDLSGLLSQPHGLAVLGSGMNSSSGANLLGTPGDMSLSVNTSMAGGVSSQGPHTPSAFNAGALHGHPPFPVRNNNKISAMQIRCKFGQLGPGKGQFNSPHGFCLGMEEDIIVADTNNHRVQVFEKTGEFKYQFGIPGREEGQLWYPRKVAVIRHSGKYVVCDRGNERSRMQIFTKSGHFIKKIAIRYIDIVAGLAITQQGHIVAVDSVSPTVFCIAESGELIKWFDCSDYMREPSDIAISGKEYFVCDFKGHCVVVFNEDGQFMRRIGCENITNYPNGIDISDAGDVLIGDSHGNRFHVAVFQRDGSLIGEFECPYVKVSRCCGLKITSEGYVVTLAKNNHHVLVLNTLYIT